MGRTAFDEWKENNPNYNRSWDGYVSPTRVEQYKQYLKKNQPKVRYSGGGGGGEYEPQPNPYADYLERINRMREEQLARQKAEADNQYNARVKNVNTGADEMLRQAYVSKMQDNRQLPQQLKSVGISGGASETTLQNLEANYANNRNSTQAQRLKAIEEAAADRDSLNAKSYNDFLENNIQTMQSVGEKAAQQEAKSNAGASGRKATISDSGKNFSSLALWVAFKKKQGFNDETIKIIAKQSGLV